MAAPRVQVATEDDKLNTMFDLDQDMVFAYKDAQGRWWKTWEAYVLANMNWPRRGRK